MHSSVSGKDRYDSFEDYANAKNEYTEALRLKPMEAEPKAQLKAIEDKLDAIAKANETEDKYDQKIALGDSLLIARSYEKAIDAYKAALTIKPGQYYPQKQITYSNAEIRNLQKENEDRARLDLYQKQKEADLKFRDALKRADQAIAEKNYTVAKAAYTEALGLKPDHAYAKQRLEIAVFQLEKESMVQAPPKPDPKKKEGKPPVTNQKNAEAKQLQEKKMADSLLLATAPLPYSSEELKTKYPDIDFTKLPPDQPFNYVPVNASGKAALIKEMLEETPRLTTICRGK